MENIKKLCKYTGKCDYQQQYKDIFEETMVSTHEQFTEESTTLPNQSEPVTETSSGKSLRQFYKVLDIKQKLLSAG